MTTGADSQSTVPHAVVLTTDGWDSYQYLVPGPGSDPSAATAVEVLAPQANQGVNLRAVGWLGEGVLATDALSCVTWTEGTGSIAQAGVALRVRSAPGGPEAITVTNNILWGARNGWNVHVWSGGVGQVVGQVVLSHSFGSTPGQQPLLPWRLCARTVGATVQFKAWSLAVDPAEPEWGDPGYGGSFALPARWVYAGRVGWYVGHLGPGERASFGDLDVKELEVTAADRLAAAATASADEVMRGLAAAVESLG